MKYESFIIGFLFGIALSAIPLMINIENLESVIEDLQDHNEGVPMFEYQPNQSLTGRKE